MKNARTFRALGLLLASQFILPAAMAGGVVLGKNLLSNGGAEAGEASTDGYTVVAVPKWTSQGDFTVVLYGAPAFPTLDSPGPANRGMQFFSGGPNNAQSSVSRTLNLKPLAADIDAGSLRSTLSGYLGGYAAQNDHADLAVTYFDAAGAELGTLSLVTVTAADRANTTGLIKRKAVGDVPVGARSARVTLLMTRTEGSYNDGYADVLSLILSKKP
jgi:hypothetical protein